MKDESRSPRLSSFILNIHISLKSHSTQSSLLQSSLDAHMESIVLPQDSNEPLGGQVATTVAVDVEPIRRQIIQYFDQTKEPVYSDYRRWAGRVVRAFNYLVLAFDHSLSKLNVLPSELTRLWTVHCTMK